MFVPTRVCKCMRLDQLTHTHTHTPPVPKKILLTDGGGQAFQAASFISKTTVRRSYAETAKTRTFEKNKHLPLYGTEPCPLKLCSRHTREKGQKVIAYTGEANYCKQFDIIVSQ